jgi:hypothetical protein
MSSSSSRTAAGVPLRRRSSSRNSASGRVWTAFSRVRACGAGQPETNRRTGWGPPSRRMRRASSNATSAPRLWPKNANGRSR